jgi:hypothetical protein
VKVTCTNIQFEKADVEQQHLGFQLAVLSNAIHQVYHFPFLAPPVSVSSSPYATIARRPPQKKIDQEGYRFQEAYKV